MRPQSPLPQSTNITSLATTAIVVAFVAWLTSFAARQDSIFARAPQMPAAAALLASPTGVAVAQRPDGAAPATARG